MQEVPFWRPEDRPSAGKLNLLSRAIRPLIGLAAGGDISHMPTPTGQAVSHRRQAFISAIRLGIITNQGPTAADVDFTDERYWVKPAYIEVTDPTGPISIEPSPPPEINGQDTEPYPLIATNLGEIKAHGHTLATDETVIVTLLTLVDDEGQSWYVIPAGGGAVLPNGNADYQTLSWNNTAGKWQVEHPRGHA